MHAGKVVEILKSKNPELEIHGIGGEYLKNAGATIFCDHSKMSGFGLNLKMIIDHLGLENDVCDYILDEFKPDAVLLIDYGTFNLRVAKRLKGKGIKVLHYIPPQVWASRKWRIKGIKKYIDKKINLKLYSKVNGKKEYVAILKAKTEDSVVVEIENENVTFKLSEVAYITPYIEF